MARDLAPILALGGFLLVLWGFHDDRTSSFDDGTFMLQIIKIVAGGLLLVIGLGWSLVEMWFK